MPSINAMAVMAAAAGGATAGGYFGWKHSANDPSMDREDRFGYAASLTLGGAGAGLAMKAIGVKGLGRMAGMGAKLGTGLAKAAMPAIKMGSIRPGRAMLKALGREKSPLIAKWAKGPLKALALGATILGGVAYSSRERPASETYGSRGDGGTEYSQQPIKDRMNLLHATGDMVFGLNNARHG